MDTVWSFHLAHVCQDITVRFGKLLINIFHYDKLSLVGFAGAVIVGRIITMSRNRGVFAADFEPSQLRHYSLKAVVFGRGSHRGIANLRLLARGLLLVFHAHDDARLADLVLLPLNPFVSGDAFPLDVDVEVD